MKTVEDYIKEIKAASDKNWQNSKYTTPSPEFGIEPGKKFIRITLTVFGQKSVHCFIDAQGNIYKAASWNARAKGIRGNINDDKKPLLGYEFYNRY